MASIAFKYEVFDRDLILGLDCSELPLNSLSLVGIPEMVYTVRLIF
jgi:hypothetical protein